MAQRTTDVIVLGAGVIGASIAYHLARAGASVRHFDRAEPATAPSASWASAGGLRSQGRHAGERALTRAAVLRWGTLAEELEADLEVRLAGHLHIAESEAECRVLAERIEADRDLGIESLDRAALRDLAPRLTERAMAGAYTRDDGQAHPGRTARSFTAAAARLGAIGGFSVDCRLATAGEVIVGVDCADGNHYAASLVVVACGAWSTGLLEAVGIDLPLRWRALQMLLSDVAPPLLGPTVTAVGRNLSLKQGPTGQLMVGGRWYCEPLAGRMAARSNEARIARQWSTAVGILPAMARQRLAHAWIGIEAQSIDGQPFVGRIAARPGLYVATGFSNHGFQISPAIGSEVAADLVGGTPAVALAAFDPARAQSVGAAERAAFRAEPIAG
jgi:sarcosine oxidase subunit beta